MLLTRSPLGLRQCCHWLSLVRLACIKHAASVRPEPGSNSPSRSLTSTEAEGQKSVYREPPGGLNLSDDWHQFQLVLLSVMQMCSNGHSGAEAPVQSPALAFSSSIPFSRSTAPHWEPLEHATLAGRWCRLPGGGRSSCPGPEAEGQPTDSLLECQLCRRGFPHPGPADLTASSATSMACDLRPRLSRIHRSNSRSSMRRTSELCARRLLT